MATTLAAGSVALLGAFGAPGAQESPAPVPPAAASEAAPATGPAAADAGPAATEDAQATAQSEPETGKSPPAEAATRPPKERFEPSEKVRADFDVSFPVDI